VTTGTIEIGEREEVETERVICGIEIGIIIEIEITGIHVVGTGQKIIETKTETDIGRRGIHMTRKSKYFL
jgi:hypothetical protein